MQVEFKVGDEITIRKIEVRPGHTLGQGGMIGVITSALGVKQAFLGEEPEYVYTMDLWWPLSPERVESESFPESHIALRTD